MINSTSKTDSFIRPDPLGGKPSPAPATPARSSEADRLTATSQESLQAALRQQPEVRPEAVALGQRLVVDANYPPKEIIRQISELLIASADLSEQA